MKTRAMVMTAVAAITMLACTRVARAERQLTVTIPFEFVAGDKTMPAGEYTIKTVGPTNAIILIDAKDGDLSAYLGSHAAVSSGIQIESKLVFNRYGDRYFLSQVWSAGYSQGRQLHKSKREKEVSLTADIRTEGQVTLVASLS